MISNRYPSLAGRTACVTGGASGIGAGIVRALVAQGAKACFLDLDNEAGSALEREMRDAGGVADFRCCDVRDVPVLLATLADLGDHHGPITMLVNNAGNDQRHVVSEVTPAYWRDRLAVNLDHVFFATQALRASMAAAGGGAVVNLGSISWLGGAAGLVAYATAKAAIHGLTKGLARELGGDQIRVNCILPGWVMTERQRELWVDAEAERLIDASQCLPGRLTPDDIAEMVLFLCSDGARMCTSQFFVVDGGWT